MSTKPASPQPDVPKFIFIIGGPGAGKGTQCTRLALSLSLSLTHISFGAIQRAELAAPNSRLAHLPNNPDRLANLAPDDLSVQLLKECIDSYRQQGMEHFLLDGFPRSIGQAVEFEKKVGPGCLMLLFEAPEEMRRERVVGRGVVSGRKEDNERDFGLRNQRFERLSRGVVGMFEGRGRLVKVDCQRTEEEVYQDVRRIVEACMRGSWS